MGLFSWECPKCGISIRYPLSGAPLSQQACTLFLPDNKVVRGIYDGYGRIEQESGLKFDIVQELLDEVKFYHSACCEEIHSFEGADWSNRAADQGIFFGENNFI